MTVKLVADGLREAVRFFETAPETANTAMRLALNQTVTRKGLPQIKRDMEAQINFPAGYLNDPSRLGIAQYASNNNLQVVIRGRDRPTSLARFAPGQDRSNSNGKSVVVRVKGKGGAVVLRKAFFVNLKNNNTGLAIRLKPGETPSNTTKAVQLDNNVWLLYGPSVDQVLRTISGPELDSISDMTITEFYRQFARLSRG